MSLARWYSMIATNGIHKRNNNNDEIISCSSSSSSSSSSFSTAGHDDNENDRQLKTPLLGYCEEDKDDEENEYRNVCLVLHDEEEEEEDDDGDHWCLIDSWCSDGRLTIFLLNFMMIVRGLLIATFVFVEGTASLNKQNDNNHGDMTTTTTTTTILPTMDRNMILLIMDILVVVFIFVFPFVVGFLGAIFYMKRMVLFALSGFVFYVLFDAVFDTSRLWACFAVVRLVCYLGVASIFIHELHKKDKKNNKRRMTKDLLQQSTKDTYDCLDENNKSDDVEDDDHQRYVLDNV